MTNDRIFERENIVQGNYRWILASPFTVTCADTIDFIIAPQAITSIVTPVIAPGTGTYPDPVSVSITCATPGATIYYTTSGNLPVVGTGFTKVYSGPFQQIQTGTVRAMAVLSGLPNSATATANLTITNPGIASNPVISPGTGSYSGLQTVTLSTATSGASIYYTTNGNLPVTDKPNTFTKLYSAPFQVNTTSTVRAMAVKSGLVNSGYSVAILTINDPTPTVATPVITPGSGIYSGTQSVSITSTTPGATIYYTTSGNTPVVGTSFTKLYSGNFILAGSATIRAMATLSGSINSAVSVSYITIGAARLAVNSFEEEINEPLQREAIRVFPNPTTGLIQLEAPENYGHVKIEIFNSIGQSVLRREDERLANKTYSIQELPSGIYSVKITAADFTQDLRLVKQ